MENLNFVDIVMLLFLTGFVIDGCVRGYILTIINFFQVLIGYPLCFFASAKLTPIVYNGYVRDLIYDKVSAKLGEVTDLPSAVATVNSYVDKLPNTLRDVVDTSKLDSITLDSSVDYVMNSIVEPVSIVVIKIILLILISALFFSLTSVLISFTENRMKLKHKSLKRVDRILGGIVGFAKYFVFLFAAVMLIDIISPYNSSSIILSTIKSSMVYNTIEQCNLFGVILGGT